MGGGAAADLARAWGLELEEPFVSQHALVLPAGDVVLKVNEPWHFETEFEADALARWDGDGAVRLLRHDRERRALLLMARQPGHARRERAAVGARLPRHRPEAARRRA